MELADILEFIALTSSCRAIIAVFKEITGAIQIVDVVIAIGEGFVQ